MQFLVLSVIISFSLSFQSHGALNCYLDNGNAKIITVDLSGKGDFKKVQDAIDYVPCQNSQWIQIQILPGDYIEKVTIPLNKRCIFLQGSGMDKTNIKWGDHASTNTSATFSSRASNIIVKDITFENTFIDDITPAVAAEIHGDKSVFYNCAFIGVQDTLGDMEGRHYFKNCRIEGAIDFIFGYAQSIYEDSDIVVNVAKYAPNRNVGTITAHGRTSANPQAGFIFKNCKIYGMGEALLGRAWNENARVIFSNTNMSNVIAPQGWDAWGCAGHESNIVFVEDNCTGPGANLSGRVHWEKNLTSFELNKFLSLSYMDQDRWIGKLPMKL